MKLNLGIKDGILLEESISQVFINEAVLTLVSPLRILGSKQLIIAVACLIALVT